MGTPSTKVSGRSGSSTAPTIRVFGNAECEFRYRESVFKRHKDWIIFSTELELAPAPTAELRKTADGILKVRLEKYPADHEMRRQHFQEPDSGRASGSRAAAGSGARVIREGKVPSAYFLEQVGAKGIQNGGIRVAEYHANLIYNAGEGTARELCEIIGDLKVAGPKSLRPDTGRGSAIYRIWLVLCQHGSFVPPTCSAWIPSGTYRETLDHPANSAGTSRESEIAWRSA